MVLLLCGTHLSLKQHFGSPLPLKRLDTMTKVNGKFGCETEYTHNLSKMFLKHEKTVYTHYW